MLLPDATLHVFQSYFPLKGLSGLKDTQSTKPSAWQQIHIYKKLL